VTSGRLSSQVVEQFLELVKRGELQPGERLPPERDLAERFGVGRNSIREALRELNMLGFVQSRHGEGTFVGAPDATRLMTPFRSVIELSTTAAESVLEFRLAFEPGAALVAAQNLSLEGEGKLRAALQEFETSLVDRLTPPEQADATFHFVVAQLTENPAIIAVHQALLGLLTTSRAGLPRDAYDPDHRIAAGHRAIFEAIVSRDAERARDAMYEHLLDVARGVEPR
jgi:GntR family transcriptional repressor for pyruvate dehydrogenase complex